MLHDGALAAATVAAKLENCFFTFFEPQAGQVGNGADALGTSVSNAPPH